MSEVTDNNRVEVEQSFLADVLERLKQTSLTEEQVKDLIETQFRSLIDDKDDPTGRKIRFGSTPEPKLMGSKFGRFGLSVGDIEHLYDMMSARKGMDPRHPGPSEELEGAFRELSDAVYMNEDEVKELDTRLLLEEMPRIPRHTLSITDQRHFDRKEFDRMTPFKRAMDTAETGFGLQLIGQQYVGELRHHRVVALLAFHHGLHECPNQMGAQSDS